MFPITVPSITGVLYELDGQRPGLSLWDILHARAFITKPRVNRLDRDGSDYRWLEYESRDGSMRYKTKLLPANWSTLEEVLELTVPEPAFDASETTRSGTHKASTIFTFRVGGLGEMEMWVDLVRGRHRIPLIGGNVHGYRLGRNRNHEWNYCWIAENPRTFFDRGDFDEIWKAMMLLKISVKRLDPELRLKGRLLNRRNTGITVFRRNLKNVDRRPYVE